MKSTYSYHVIYQAEPEGGFTVLVPALQGCITYGRTFEEAREMIQDAIGGYIESLRKHGETIPSDQRTITDIVDVRHPSSSKATKARVYA